LSSHKIYIASPFFNEEQLKEVEQIEMICEKCKYDYFSPRKSQSTDFVKTLEQDDWLFELGKKFFFIDDIVQLDECDMIIVNPNNYDSGTLFELGYAIAKGLKIFPSHQKYDRFIKDTIIKVNQTTDRYGLVYTDEHTKIAYVFAETSDEKYEGFSKVMLGYLYANGFNIKYFDVPRKSNIMLTSACSVYEFVHECDLKLAKQLLFDSHNEDKLNQLVKECATFVTGRVDD